ncbi:MULTISPECIES: L,D-transpeptidase [Maribacter]|uniref:L,D-transpeptidase n=1 Tax=Maribacter flavus TaxID=1658664 RepID=A0A5B2TZ40_9FLAO|nr:MULTISPECIES: L,D-transpeptidase [Maribacter]KAA2219821.1 L,D-transpeptidase [Maribacter flavus]MDC6405266.1 L,D-transpeptidase [Maribacter sp. PR66]MEE1971925.1 L,D-transpeptidase [Maribacter flavus]
MVKLVYFGIWSLLLILTSCNAKNSHALEEGQTEKIISYAGGDEIKLPKMVPINRNVTIGEYFDYIDSLVIRYDSLLSYQLSEHVIVRNNPWIIDTLANTDYYRMISRDSFVYDQRQLTVLPKGSQLFIPDSIKANQILGQFAKTEIDVNIPEFKLRIFQDSVLLYTFPVRVGQNRERYLKFGDRITDLRTKTGSGTIIDYVRHPEFYNPVNGKQFYVTKRDDGKTTIMPQIPWIETEINGIRNGQMIHPTTNPETLGKAYSNGCIGTREADAWIIYYYSPNGTKLRIRYDLKTYEEGRVVAVFKDIYDKNN